MPSCVPAVRPQGAVPGCRDVEHSQGGGTADIWIYDLDQETFSRLTFEGTNTDPFWSTDGSEVGFASSRGGPSSLYARPADLSGQARLLLAGEGEPLSDARWIPDGRQLVYQRGAAGASDVLYAAPDPDSAPVVFLDTPLIEGDPSISPDGRWLTPTSRVSLRFTSAPFQGLGAVLRSRLRGGPTPSGRTTEGRFSIWTPAGLWL